jgi:hypothetical protein
LNSLIGRDKSQEIRGRLAASRVTLAENERQLKRIVDAMLATDAPPAAFAERARRIEADIKEIQHAIKYDEAALLTEANTPTVQAAEKWASLIDAVKDEDIDARMTVRKLVVDTFEKIVLYRFGTVPPATRKAYAKDKEWEILLVSRSGVTRQIRVSRDGQLLGIADENRQAVA